MTQSTPRNATGKFFVIGLAFIFIGIAINEWTLTRISLLFGVGLNLSGTDSIIRIWALKTVFILVGVPLVLHKYRSTSGTKLLFDISIGILTTAVLLLCIEGIFYRLNTSNQPVHAKSSVNYSEPYVELDELLGYQLKPDLEVSVVQTIEDKVIYEVIYSMDKNRRRITPVANADNRTNFILFFGGSFTFGDGVENDETLPAYIGEFASKYIPYNYGVPGYGTQHMLVKLQDETIIGEVDQMQGVAVYNFICPHISRVIGTMGVQNSQGKLMPYYTLDSSDKLVRKGNLASGRPFISALYAVIGFSQTAKYFNIKLPRIGAEHINLTVRIIEESAKVFKEKFNSDAFYVLIYPTTCTSIIPDLDKSNIKYLDYSSLLPGNEEFWQPDGHPTAKAHKLVAEKLSRDIGIVGEND